MLGLNMLKTVSLTTLLVSLVNAADVISTSASGSVAYTIGNGTYFSGNESLVDLSYTSDSSKDCPSVIPVTSIIANESTITADYLKGVIDSFAQNDDVYTLEFMSSGAGLAVQFKDGYDATFSEDAVSYLSETGLSHLFLCGVQAPKGLDINIIADADLDKVPNGPIAARVSNTKVGLYRSYLLVRDHYETCLFGVYQSELNPDTYYPCDIFIPRYQDPWLPLPSRVWYWNDGRQLAGLRMMVKDLYDIKGLETGGGSRDYAFAYGEADDTAPAVKILLEHGAVPVGKTKLSQFAHGANPWEFIDIQYPWSARGDGYQNSQSSSSGSAAAIASYEWVDIALGSDTRGSVRKPASCVGVYGNRPTHGALSLERAIPLAERLDTAGFFARDPALFAKVQRIWYTDSLVPTNVSFSSLPKKIFYPIDVFPVASNASQARYEEFLNSMADALGMEIQNVNVSGLLLASNNSYLNNFTIFQTQSNILAENYSWKHVGQPLAEIWQEKYDKYPTFDPNPRNAFARAQKRTDADYDRAVQTRNEFRDFALENILPANEETCSEGILVYDIGTGGRPNYREQTLNTVENGASSMASISNVAPTLGYNYIASTAGAPDFTVPIGQIDYNSVISLRTEQAPLSIQFVATPGCDSMLISVIESLAEKGLITTTKTGRTPF